MVRPTFGLGALSKPPACCSSAAGDSSFVCTDAVVLLEAGND